MATVSKFAEKIVAETAGVRGVLREICNQGAAQAKALLAPHDHAGGAKITKSRGKIDFFWSLEDDDSGSGEPAAMAIELGWTTRTGRPVEGLHIIQRSAGRL